MSDQGNRKVYAPGERIVTEGDPGHDVMVLLRGEVSVWRGRTELGRVRGQGDLLGELAALTGRPRSASIIAATEVEILWIKMDLASFSRMHPDILDKIDRAIRLRFDIACNKTRIYCGEASHMRRALLFEVMVRREMGRAGKLQADKENAIIKKTRRSLDEEFELHQSNDDPRVLAKIADDHGVLTDFNGELQKQTWLDELLLRKFTEIADDFKLISSSEGLNAMRERAKLTVEMLDLLNEFENAPGVTKQMDLAKLEEVIPIETRSKALFDVVRNRCEDDDPKNLRFLERKVMECIEKQKLSAGFDRVPIFKAATELGVVAAYEEELRKILEMTGTSSTYVDLAPVSAYEP